MRSPGSHFAHRRHLQGLWFSTGLVAGPKQWRLLRRVCLELWQLPRLCHRHSRGRVCRHFDPDAHIVWQEERQSRDGLQGFHDLDAPGEQLGALGSRGHGGQVDTGCCRDVVCRYHADCLFHGTQVARGQQVGSVDDADDASVSRTV